MLHIMKQNSIATIVVPDIKNEELSIEKFLEEHCNYYFIENGAGIYFYFVESGLGKFGSQGMTYSEWEKFFMTLLDKTELKIFT